ncbi:MAG: hypothetical protein K2I78_00620, partial [Clostridia bacterium]|nr:hypothetical protein [Clostridia bacterium]
MASTTTSYCKFANKSNYTFTDKTKIASYRASADNTGTDTTTIEVDSSAMHGSQSNPYVIDNFAGWTHFVTEMRQNSNDSYTYGQGKYYVLAVDLDFDASGAPAEEPLYGFGGTLYGLGHTISNWKFTENTSSVGLGLIRYSLWNSSNSNVTISDLNMDNYQLNNAGQDNGAIIGWVPSNQTWLLNCHTKGVITRQSQKKYWIYGGGIVGAVKRATANTGQYEVNATIYRCSSDIVLDVIDVTVPTGNTVGIGGVAGYCEIGCNLNIYDCYANAKQTVNIGTMSEGVYAGSMVGFASIGKSNGFGGSVNFSGCVGKVVSEIIGDGVVAWYHGGLAGYCERTGADVNTVATSNIENIYVSGTSIGSSLGAAKTWAWLVRKSDGETSNGRANIKSSGDIYYTSEDSPAGEWPWTTLGRYKGNMVSGSVTPTLIGTATTSGETQLWTTAKNSTKLKSKIWSQKENIGNTYTIQNS